MKYVTDAYVTPSDIGFAITADSGELATQADVLVRSLRKQYPTAPVLTFIPESSVTDIDAEIRTRLEQSTTVVTGEIPIPEYPISALVYAFVEAVRRFSSSYLVALDTDTIVLDRLRVSSDGDVWLRPADVGAQRWTSRQSQEDWATLYRRFNLQAPTPFFQQTASVDRQPIPPYWNSGVVVTTDMTLPKRWLEYTETLFREDELPVSQTEFFLDQISLAVAVQENQVQQLSERENFPLGGRLRVPTNVAVIHYGDRRNLARIVNPDIRETLHQLGALPTASVREYLFSLLVVASTKSGRVLPFRWKQWIRRLLSTA
mgnify:CR=1 FL=1